MKLFRKLKNKRGMTLVEVLMVVALMTIMLGIAMPNILAESQNIKLATMDGYARSVAVAVQSKLYGMKDAGTAEGSSYSNLNAAAAEEHITVADEEKAVKYVCNFGENAAVGKQYLLSGMLTDTEILQNGKIVVIYDPDTANVLEVYYAESEFDISALFPTALESFLQEHVIGSYLGYGAPAPERTIGLPRFACAFQFDDELYLDMQMMEDPSPQLLDKKLGLEIYAEIPMGEEGTPYEVGIYYQGFFATNYTTQFAGIITADADSSPLTLRDIQSNSGHMRFALDSLITEKAGYGNASKYLRHQSSPQYTTVTDPRLYPRESIATWFDPAKNPYITVWHRENQNRDPEDLHNKIFSTSTKVTEYVGVDKTMKLKIRLSVLSEETRDAVGMPVDAPNAEFYQKDENFISFETETQPVSPYFYALSNDSNKVTISAMRDLNNLKYVFATENTITEAELSKNVTGQETYDKLLAVRYELLKKSKLYNQYAQIENDWNRDANTDAITSEMLTPMNPFTLSGDGYAIIGIGFGGRADNLGGLFSYANGLTVKNLDIIDCSVMRNGFDHSFFTTDTDGDINGIDEIRYPHAITGSLVGVAVNCTFTNVHVYIDRAREIQLEAGESTYEDYFDGQIKRYPQNFGYRRLSGVVVGGLVGMAIGSPSTGITTWPTKSTGSGKSSTTFSNCSASINVGAELYDQTSKCIYSGGLVGVTMGNVQIENSFAACQLGGYYAGGLVGGVVPPTEWEYNNDGRYGYKYNEGMYYGQTGQSSGGLTINKSFASGIILRQVRVGGGLIADIGSNIKPDVKNCYSSVKWQILPPTAYGTFEGDTRDGGDTPNYYIVQTYFAVPVTTNTEVHFRCKGDVFSLQDKKNGVACANETDLKEKLGDGWVEATETYYWMRGYGDYYDTEGGVEHKYPFPMPDGNSEFSGSWIMETLIGERDGAGHTNEKFYDNTTSAVPAGFTSEFSSFICAYYYGIWSSLPQRNIDSGVLYEEPFYTVDNDVFLQGTALKAGMWWITTSLTTPGEGLTTFPSYDNGQYQFTGFAYNDPLFDPLKQDTFKPTLDDGQNYINNENVTLNWDYFGLYLGDLYGDYKSKDKTYYIQFDESVQKGMAQLDDTNQVCRINPKDFSPKETTFLLSESATIQWDEKDGFHVNGGGAG